MKLSPRSRRMVLAALCLGIWTACFWPESAAPSKDRVQAPPSQHPEVADVPAHRAQLLSLTYQPPEWSPEAFKATYDFIAEHGDMIAHFMDDGVPWPEALSGAPFSAALRTNIGDRVNARRPQQKLLLAVNPVSTQRNDLARYFGESDGLPLPEGWQGRTWDDPEVAQAYLNYVQRLATVLEPDFLCYAFEVNSNWVNQPPQRFAAFLHFLRVVRDGLRKAFPETPLLIEVVLGDDAYMADRWRHTEALVPFADILSISTYPYLFDTVAANNATVPPDWFRRLKDRVGNTPLAVQETGFLGADFHHPGGRTIPGRGDRPIMVIGEESSQARYVQFLLEEANALDFHFVNWWVWRDLDRLWQLISKQEQFADPMAAQWNHTGLQGMDGVPRQAQRIWDAWHALPLRQPGPRRFRAGRRGR